MLKTHKNSFDESEFIVNKFIRTQDKDALFYEWAVKSILFGLLEIAYKINASKQFQEGEGDNAT